MADRLSVSYRNSADGIGPGQLTGFFEGWPNPPDPATHLRILRGSDHVVLAVDEASGMVVGFVTAVSDGVLAAFVPLLEVRADWRGRGVGGELVRRVLEQLDGLYMVDLGCDEELAPFYERLGFERGRLMLRRDYAAQAGRPPAEE